MHRILAAFLVTFVMAGCQEGSSPSQRGESDVVDAIPVGFNVEGNPITEFEVPAFECEVCCQGACEALAVVPGVVDVHASPVSKRVVMAIDDAYFDLAAARKALEDRFGKVIVLNESAASGDSE